MWTTTTEPMSQSTSTNPTAPHPVTRDCWPPVPRTRINGLFLPNGVVRGLVHQEESKRPPKAGSAFSATDTHTRSWNALNGLWRFSAEMTARESCVGGGHG